MPYFLCQIRNQTIIILSNSNSNRKIEMVEKLYNRNRILGRINCNKNLRVVIWGQQIMSNTRQLTFNNTVIITTMMIYSSNRIMMNRILMRRMLHCEQQRMVIKIAITVSNKCFLRKVMGITLMVMSIRSLKILHNQASNLMRTVKQLVNLIKI